jgi:hypothetical protein
VPPRLPEAQRVILQRAADEQYRQEELAWIDLARFPDEPAAAYDTDFRAPEAHHALGAYRMRYRELEAARRSLGSSTAPETALRGKLEGLGYVENGPAPTSPRDGFRLPAPVDHRTLAPR